MSTTSSGAAGSAAGRPQFRRPQVRIRPRIVLPLLGLLVLVILLLTVGQDIYVDLLFYRDVHATDVFSTVLVTRVILFVLAGVLAATAVGSTAVLAYALRPTYVPMSPEQQQLEQYRVGLQPLRLPLLLLFSTIVGVSFGAWAQSRWRVVQLWLHGQSFGVKDPQFHRDISYYTFTLPFERSVLGGCFTAVFLCLLTAAAVHYLYGGVRVQTRGEKVSAAARAHISVLLGLFILGKAVAYWLDRYGLNFSKQGSVTGAGYTDVHATLPAKNILVVIAVICAGLFFANAFRRGFTLPALGLGLMVLSAIVVGGLYPFLVQQFEVKPNEINREAPYIGRNIAATRSAYQIEPQTTSSSGKTTGNIVTTNFAAAAVPAASAVTTSDPNVSGARLLDPNVLQQTFEQLQQVRSYFGFPSSLDVDRYTINGTEQEDVIATRDVNLAGLPASQRNWPNDHLVYTHGVGIVAAPVNAVTNGQPAFSVKDLPVTGADGGTPAIPITQDRIYYGELSPAYSIVDSKQLEVDGPNQASYHYQGDTGVTLGTKFVRRLALAVHFKDYNLFFSSAVTKDSKILYYRDPRQRVGKVAPWLTLDGDPYPAVVDGRVTWIVDGYTTSNNYPYSQRVSLGGTTTDSTVQNSSNVAAQAGHDINYIRNSVKATVDAYTGKVTLYAFENGVPDPVLRTWEKVFPHTVQPESAIPADLRAHLRYPEDLFKVQRDLIARYHVSDPKAFFQGTDFWQVPADPVDASTSQPPYYLQVQLPGQSEPEFNLTTSLNFNNRPNLAAYVGVSSDPQDYGTIRVLDLPSDVVVNGPRNVESMIRSDAQFSPQYSLLNQNGSAVVTGNLLAIPVGNGLLYIEPFYAQGTGTETYPLLRYVVVVYGDKVGFAPTLAQAISNALAGGGGTTTTAPVTTTPTPGASATPTPSGSIAPGATATLAQLQALVDSDFATANAALKAGQLGAYQAAEAQAQSDYAKLVAALSAATGAKPSTTPSPSATK